MPTFSPLASRNCARRIRRLLGTACAAAFLTAAGFSATGFVNTAAAQSSLAQAQTALDTSRLPRPAAIKQLAAFPQTTIILSAETVPGATKAALTLLEADGWQRYVTPRSQPAQILGSETHQLKKGPHAMVLSVQTAPAQDNATAVSYTAMPLARDLPFPSQASDIQFAPNPIHLDATTSQPQEALLAYYRTELAAAGWALHSASDGSAPKLIPTEKDMHHAFFTHPGHGAIQLRVRTIDVSASTVAVRSVPASVLPGAQQVARAPEPVAPQPNPNAAAHAQMSQTMEAMKQDLMRQALQPPPANGAGLDAALAAARSAGVRIDRSGKPQSSSAVTVAPEPAKEPELQRDEAGGLPIPKPYTSKSLERSLWRVEAHAAVQAGQDNVLAFYRRELGALGWRETTPAKTEGNRTVIAYASPEGPAVLTLERKSRETTTSLLLRKEVDARKSGLMPKAGHAKLLFGNVQDADSTVMIGGRTIKIASGAGARSPDGPSLDVPPGDHRLTIKSPGKRDVVEVVKVEPDSIWGVLLGPGGALSLPMY